ncbi:MAG: hypothetical protein E4G94_00265, partial [ANME-2 cluster archaeon]
MADITTLNGNLLLKTDPPNPTEKLSVARTDTGATKPLAQIKMFGDGMNNFQGVMAFGTMNSGSPNGPLEERMRVHLNGNVGIATDDPKAKLHIEGTNDASLTGDGLLILGTKAGNNLVMDNNKIMARNAGNIATLNFQTDGGDLAVHGLQNNSQKFVVKHDGNVGIGTPSPKNKLDVEGGVVIGTSYSGTKTAPSNGLLVEGKVGIGTDNPNIHLAIGDSDTGLKQQGDGELAIITNNQERVRIDKSGYVGIGAIDPNEKLEINGSIRGNQSGALRISTGYGYVDVGPKNSGWSHFVTDRSKYYFNKEIRVTSGMIGSYAEDLSLCTSGTERIRVKRSNGYVGIGTNNPLAKLHVNGKLHLDDDITLSPSYYSVDQYG